MQFTAEEERAAHAALLERIREARGLPPITPEDMLRRGFISVNEFRRQMAD